MARQSKLSTVTGLTRIQMINELGELGIKVSSKTNMQRVEKKYQQEIGTSSNKKLSKPTQSKVTLNELKTRKPKKNLKENYLTTQVNGKNVRISNLTGLTLEEMRTELKSAGVKAGRSFKEVESQMVLHEYNKHNPLNPAKSISELNTTRLSDDKIKNLDAYRKFGGLASNPEDKNKALLNASRSSIQIANVRSTTTEFVEKLIVDIIDDLGLQVSYNNWDLSIISNRIVEADLGVKISGLKQQITSYVTIIEKYFEQKGAK